MERGNRALAFVLLATVVVAGGRFVMSGTSSPAAEEEKTRANLFSGETKDEHAAAYPTREEINEALGR